MEGFIPVTEKEARVVGPAACREMAGRITHRRPSNKIRMQAALKLVGPGYVGTIVDPVVLMGIFIGNHAVIKRKHRYDSSVEGEVAKSVEISGACRIAVVRNQVERIPGAQRRLPRDISAHAGHHDHEHKVVRVQFDIPAHIFGSNQERSGRAALHYAPVICCPIAEAAAVEGIACINHKSLQIGRTVNPHRNLFFICLPCRIVMVSGNRTLRHRIEAGISHIGR